MLCVSLLAASLGSPLNDPPVVASRQRVVAIRWQSDFAKGVAHVQAAGCTVAEQFDHNRALVVLAPHHALPHLLTDLRGLAGVHSVTRLNITFPVGMPMSTPATPHAQMRPGSAVLTAAMCVMVKDQHADIGEWVEHYLTLGVGMIHLYDNGSDPPLLHTVRHFVQSGVVVYTWLPDELAIAVSASFVVHFETRRNNLQWFVFSECLAPRIKRQHTWMAFFDVDEFLILRNTSVKDLPTFLSAYSAYGGLAVNWMNFGSSGHLERPNGSTLASYWQCCTRKHVKTIVNTKHVLSPKLHPHNFFYRRGAFCVDENFGRVDDAFTDSFSGSRVVLNHYVTKSRGEFLAKLQRGGGAGGRKTPAFLETMDRLSQFNCTDAAALMQQRRGQRRGTLVSS